MNAPDLSRQNPRQLTDIPVACLALIIDVRLCRSESGRTARAEPSRVTALWVHKIFPDNCGYQERKENVALLQGTVFAGPYASTHALVPNFPAVPTQGSCAGGELTAAPARRLAHSQYTFWHAEQG
jgi:hypothetical protein